MLKLVTKIEQFNTEKIANKVRYFKKDITITVEDPPSEPPDMIEIAKVLYSYTQEFGFTSYACNIIQEALGCDENLAYDVRGEGGQFASVEQVQRRLANGWKLARYKENRQ